MRRKLLTAIAPTVTALTLATGAAAAPMGAMHPRLGARLAGMGEHGTVNLRLSRRTHRICWAFHLPMVAHVTRASIHAGRNGPTLLELGMRFTRSGCEREPAMTLAHLEARPRAYFVWVNTKGHPGDLRGRLFAGTAMGM